MIGRSLANSISIDEKGISRHHCRIRVSDEGCSIEDLNSSFGTLVNGKMIKKAMLKPGDRIRLGDALLQLESLGEEAAGAAAAPQPPPATAAEAPPPPATPAVPPSVPPSVPPESQVPAPAAVEPSGPATDASAAAGEEGVVFCPKCEMPNLIGEPKCIHCGVSLGQPA